MKFSRWHERQVRLKGDFDDTGETVTEILDRVRPAGYNGRTWQDVIPPGVYAVKQPGRDTHPLAFHGAPVPAPGRPAIPPAAPAPLAIAAAPATPAQDALTHICLEVKRLAAKGQLDRVSDEKLADVAARRRDGLRQPRTTAKVIIDRALEHLRAGREPWTPDGAA